MKREAFTKLTTFLCDLEQKGISYTLAHHRDDAIMVFVAAPGERWEIEFLDDGSVETEKFISNGEIYGEQILNELFARYAYPEEDVMSSDKPILLIPDSKAA